MVDLESIMQTYETKISTASKRARTADSIDEALEIQAQAYAEAIKQALSTFIEQAEVNGGVCSPNGPIAKAKIT